MDKRNYGIDILRIVAMLFIVILHSLGKGGLLLNLSLTQYQYKSIWLLEIIAFCAVDIFALISGYVSYKDDDTKVKYSNYFVLWFEVVFYGLLINGVFDIINPNIVGISSYIRVIFPVYNGLYWYFTAYTGLYILMPLINKGIKNCSNETLKKLFLLIIIVFSIFDTFTNRFSFSKGYTFIWVVLIYILGAIMKKCEIGKNIKKIYSLSVIIILYAITFLYKIYGLESSLDYSLITYTSPTILGVGILYVVLFSKIEFKNNFKNLIKFVAPAAFSIYLINNHNLIWKYVMKDLFINFAGYSALKTILYPLVFSILFVIGSILIDRLRILIFNVLKVKELSQKIEEFLNKLFDKIITRL